MIELDIVKASNVSKANDRANVAFGITLISRYHITAVKKKVLLRRPLFSTNWKKAAAAVFFSFSHYAIEFQLRFSYGGTSW